MRHLSRAYVFVDAENNFIRTTAAAASILESEYAAQAISLAAHRVSGVTGFPHVIEGRRIGWNPDLQLFWDCELLSPMGLLSHVGLHIQRAIHVCACTGDEDKAYDSGVLLRKYGFEPIVIRESKDLKRHRDNSLKSHHLIEKAKGCDIALATRMVADAALDLYDYCLLFTSDADFIPAIEAVRRMGKVVFVFGYSESLPKRSPYLHIPDRFIDLGSHLQNVLNNNDRGIRNALQDLMTKAGRIQ